MQTITIIHVCFFCTLDFSSMRIFTNTTHTTVGDLSENPTNATSETNEDTSSIGPGNDASKEVILAAGIVDIITAGISLIGFLGEFNVN